MTETAGKHVVQRKKTALTGLVLMTWAAFSGGVLPPTGGTQIKLLNTASVEMANCPQVSGPDVTLAAPFHLSPSVLHH